ncbi:hypothetical protein BsWGS_20932 [Bradybaena similaris]
MKSLQISFVLGFLLMLFGHVANGFHFYGPYDVYNSRTARWPAKDVGNRPATISNGSGFPNEPDFYTIISYLNDVGKRRK